MQYVVLRDAGSPLRRDRFSGGTITRGVASPAEPRVEVADLTPGDVQSLSRDTGVASVAPVMPLLLIRPLPADDAATDSADDALDDGTAWGVRAVGADTSARTGVGVTVAVLDTGVDAAHPAFAGLDIVAQDFTGTGSRTGDVQGHGTHCAGTIAGRDVGGVRIGVARGLPTLLSGKVLGDDGSGDSTMLFRGIEWALQGGARVISMSLGFDFPGLVARLVAGGWPVDLATSAALEAYRANLRMFDALMAMVRSRDAFGLGAVVVAAAGNESRRDLDPEYAIAASLPAAAEDVLSVGALGQGTGGLAVAPFSNTFPRLAAPGVAVVSARAGTAGLRQLSGTSMACPHVAGVAALWWEEVLATDLPPTADVVVAKLLATASTQPLAAGVEPADRGTGLVRCP